VHRAVKNVDETFAVAEEPTYVMWQSFEKIGAETAEKVFRNKKKQLDIKRNGRSVIRR